MNISDFDFELPEDLIAQQPLAERDASRMLTLERATGAWQDRNFRELPEFLQAGDLLVLNDSRVVPARLLGKRVLADGTLGAGEVEALLLETLENGEWNALVRPGKHLREGARMVFGDDCPLEAEVVSCGEFGERRLRFAPVEDFYPRLERWGHMPLPPYIRRADSAADRERYAALIEAGRS